LTIAAKESQPPTMSAIGTKQTSNSTLNMSAFGGEADILEWRAKCPLMSRKRTSQQQLRRGRVSSRGIAERE